VEYVQGRPSLAAAGPLGPHQCVWLLLMHSSSTPMLPLIYRLIALISWRAELLSWSAGVWVFDNWDGVARYMEGRQGNVACVWCCTLQASVIWYGACVVISPWCTSAERGTAHVKLPVHCWAWPDVCMAPVYLCCTTCCVGCEG